MIVRILRLVTVSFLMSPTRIVLIAFGSVGSMINKKEP